MTYLFILVSMSEHFPCSAFSALFYTNIKLMLCGSLLYSHFNNLIYSLTKGCNSEQDVSPALMNFIHLSSKSKGRQTCRWAIISRSEMCEAKGAGCGGKLIFAVQRELLVKITLNLQAQ